MCIFKFLEVNGMIIKLSDGKFQLRSKNGRKMGLFDNRYRAGKRFKEVEASKEVKDEHLLKEDLFDGKPITQEELKQIDIERKERDEQKKRDEKNEKDAEKGKRKKSLEKVNHETLFKESSAGIAAPDMSSQGVVPISSKTFKINLGSERTTDLFNIYGTALNKGEDDEKTDNEAKKYIGNGEEKRVYKLPLAEAYAVQVRSTSSFAQKVKEYLDKHAVFFTFRINRHIDVMERYLKNIPPESILKVIVGMQYIPTKGQVGIGELGKIGMSTGIDTYMNTGTVILAFTNDKIYIGHKNIIFGEYIKTINRNRIDDITIIRGLIWANINIESRSEKIIIGQIHKNATEEIQHFLDDYANVDVKLERSNKFDDIPEMAFSENFSVQLKSKKE